MQKISCTLRTLAHARTDEHLRTVIRLIGVPRAAAMIYETHPTTHVQPRARLGGASLAAAP